MRTNVPTPPTPLIGREWHVETARQLLRDTSVRLLTITGPGGVGKTHLALQVAIHLMDDFADGVFFVSLAPISDPRLVISTIAQTLGLREAGDRRLAEQLGAYLQDKHLLLLLDNFEQVAAAALQVAELLTTCPRLKVLVTSRVPLHVRAERQFPVPPLALPDLKQPPALETLSQYAAVALFIERTLAVKPDFQVTDTSLPVIAEICHRLDGLPLAIELAAARVKFLSPLALLARLIGDYGSTSLRLLTGGAQDLPARQQTMEHTIEWSYQLLSVDEQKLFRRLSIFVGGCTLAAAEAVCNTTCDLAIDILEGVTSLADKNLLRQIEQKNGEPRLMMLETIREYGQEHLLAEEEGTKRVEREAIQLAHMAYYLALVEEAEPQLMGAEQAGWLDRLELELENIRTALRRSLEQGASNMALRFGAALWRFWLYRGYLSEGRHWLAEVLAGTRDVVAPVRAKALSGAGTLAFYQGDYSPVGRFCEESLELSRQLGEKRGVVSALNGLVQVATVKGDYTRACALCEESVAICRGLDDRWSLANALCYHGIALWMTADALACTLFEEALALFRELGDRWGIAFSLYSLGYAVVALGEYAAGHTFLEQALTMMEELGDRRSVARCLNGLGDAAFGQHDYKAAQALYEEATSIHRALGDKWFVAIGLNGLAGVAVAEEQLERAARLLGAADMLHETIGTMLPPRYRSTCESVLATARAGLEMAAFAVAWAQGRTMPLDQVLAAQSTVRTTAAAQTASSPPSPTRASRESRASSAGLTAREMEVLLLVATGLTDAQVAEQLVISPRTVHTHLNAIYGKLGVSSRTAATRYALDHHLA